MTDYKSQYTGAQIDDGVAKALNSIQAGSEATTMLISILRKALYESDQSEAITALAAALSTTEVPDGPVDIAKDLVVITGNAGYAAGVRLYYKADSTRCATNPIAFRVESGKKYTVSFDNYSQYGFYVAGYSYSGTETNYQVVEGTTKNFEGDYSRVLQSGWQTADYTFTPDGTYQVVSVQLRKGSNLEMSSADADAIKQILHIYVEEV